MMKPVLIASAILAIAAAGCQKPNEQSASTTPPATSPAPAPVTASTPIEAQKPAKNVSKPPSKPIATKPAPKTPTLPPLSTSQAKDPVAIAARMDQMIRGLHDVEAATRVIAYIP